MMLPCMPNFVKYKNFAGQLESKDEKFVVCVATKSCSTRKKKTNKQKVALQTDEDLSCDETANQL